jgi:ribosomal protein S18 acetylase RimI-like enzyme
MFNISPATEQDIPAIVNLAEQTWWPTYSAILTPQQIRYMLDTIYAPETLRSQITGGSQSYLVLYADGELKAFASFSPRTDDPEVFKIHKLYVLPGNQGKGYGRELVHKIKALLSEKGIHKLDLNVNRYNPALHFYEKYGFKTIREEDIPIGPYWMNDYVMRLEF